MHTYYKKCIACKISTLIYVEMQNTDRVICKQCYNAAFAPGGEE